MKTNLVKKGSEKNIEMFEMSNGELAAVNGGTYAIGVDENGRPIIIVIGQNVRMANRFFNHNY